MGENVRATNIRYYSIINGKISRRVKKDTAGAIARENKLGETVYELQFDSLSGRLKDIQIEFKEKFGKQAKIILTEDGTDFCLNFSFSGSQSMGFFKRLPNIKPEIPIEIHTGIMHDVEKNKDRHWLTVKQNGTKVEYFYTKENPNGLPDMEQITVKGIKQWDSTKQLEFIEAYLNNEFLPKLRKVSDIPDNSEIQDDISDLPPVDDINYPSHNSSDDLPY